MEQFKAVYNSALKFLVPRTPQETYITTVREAMNLVNAKDGSLFLPSKKEGEVVRIYTTNKKLYKVKPRTDGLTNTTFQTGVGTLRHRKELVKDHPKFKDSTYESDLTIPLVYSHITMGVVSVLSERGKRFTQKDLDVLNYFAPLATLAIRNAHLNNELREAIEMRDLFISMAAHEFKNPISIIILASELLQRKIDEKKEIGYRDIEYLKTNVVRLSRMLDELMNVSQIKQGKLEFNLEKVDINKLLTKNVEEFRLGTKSHKISLRKFKSKAIVKADKDKLNRAITNIINNAEKFSPKGSSIYCSIKQIDEYYEISVKDQGRGISKADLAKIFEHFYRGKDNAGKPGMGLGLYVVKNIVEGHNGRIEIDSKLNHGTKVKIYLPVLK